MLYGLVVGITALLAGPVAESIGGMSPGDSRSAVVKRFGDLGPGEESLVPGARDYTVDVDAKGGIVLVISIRADAVVALSAEVTGKVPLDKVRPDLSKASTARGLLLTGDAVKLYGRPSADYAHESEDVVIYNFPLGQLQLVCVDTFWGDEVMLTQMVLVRRGFKKQWLRLRGPI